MTLGSVILWLKIGDWTGKMVWDLALGMEDVFIQNLKGGIVRGLIEMNEKWTCEFGV